MSAKLKRPSSAQQKVSFVMSWWS